MGRRPLDDEQLQRAVREPGFQPSRTDLDDLLARLGGDDDAAEAAERAAARLGLAAARAAMAQLDGARPPARARLCRLVGRVAAASAGGAPGELRAFLLARLGDADAKTRRNAIIALGKLDGADIEAALIGAWDAADLPARRSIAAALGKMGGAAARTLLDGIQTDDKELDRITREARLKLARTLERSAPGRIDPTRAPAVPLPLMVHCRDGLESFVVEELKSVVGARAHGPGRVGGTLRGPLAELAGSRAWLRFGFPLPVTPGVPIDAAVAGALASDAAWAIFNAFTVGTPRYRIEWASGGHRRGLTFRVAEQVAARRPTLRNDPTDSLWEAVVTESGPSVAVELWPRGLPDERFAYRRAHVPASSHPTLAAALARVGGVRADDVVWDPFVGAGTELIERARLGPFAALHGSDLDPAALARAQENFDAAGLVGVTLAHADARQHQPPGVTLILTNPPMGRRVLNRHLTGALYDEFLAHAAAILPRGGRLVWISPRAEDTVARAAAVGLTVVLRQRVDMAGFWAEIQSFVKRPAR